MLLFVGAGNVLILGFMLCFDGADLWKEQGASPVDEMKLLPVDLIATYF